MSQDRHRRPPGWIDQFLEWYCADEILEEVQGDLHESYYDHLDNMSKRKANWLYLFDVLRFFKWRNINPRIYTINTFHMFGNYLKITVRNFGKNKIDNGISLLGLVLGVTCCLLIALHVRREMSYDDFHPAKDRTYRVVMDMFTNGELSVQSAVVFPGVGPGLRADFPEVENYARILPFGSGVYSYQPNTGESIRFNEERAVLADASFFDLFGFKLIKGDPTTALAAANTAVLSESTARRYFGNTDPVGKTLTCRGRQKLEVTGVMQDFPTNSHMQFDIIYSLSSINGFEELPGNFGWYDFYTFIRLHEDTDPGLFGEKIKRYLHRKKEGDHETSGELLWLQNIGDIHLHSRDLGWDMGNNGGVYQVYFLTAIALLVLLIAWINFINLNTARSVTRAREVGIRKVVGARRMQLLRQFLSESFIYNLVAILIAVLAICMALPFINHLFDLNIAYKDIWSWEVILSLLVLSLAGGLIAGIYPARVLSSFQPLTAIQDNAPRMTRRFGFRQILVLFQFTMSMVLMMGTLLIFQQLRFMQEHDLGLNIDQTLVVKAPSSGQGEGDLPRRLKVFREKLEQIPEIRGMTISSIVPGIENFGIGDFSTRISDKVVSCYRVMIDEFFINQFDIELIAGREFSAEMRRDTAAVILNENAVHQFGFESAQAALGEKLNPASNRPWTIVGVVKDYHHQSLKESLDPALFFYNNQVGNYYSLKVQSSNYEKLIAGINDQWNDIYPDNPFDYFFLDDRFARQYEADQRFNKIFTSFAFLTILIACMGLYGLISYTAEQSRKEISIRKILGASVPGVVLHLLKEYMLLMTGATVLAIPIAWYCMTYWLESFAYQTDLHWSIFAIGLTLIIIVTLCTVSFKSWSAAQTNPAQVLRGR